MRMPIAVSAIFLVACYGPGGNADTTRVDGVVLNVARGEEFTARDSGTVSAPAVHDSTPRADTGNVPAGGDLELSTDKASYQAANR